MLSPTYITTNSPQDIENFQHKVAIIRSELYMYENIMYAQILTHQILDILKPSIFTEFKYLGSRLSVEYTLLQKLKLYDYFDVKNETLDYSGFELREEHSPQATYYQRLTGKSEQHYACLIQLSKTFLCFPSAAENLCSEYQYLLTKAGSIKIEEEAILKIILREPEFQMWHSLREKYMFSTGVAPLSVKETNPETSPTQANRLKI